METGTVKFKVIHTVAPLLVLAIGICVGYGIAVSTDAEDTAEPCNVEDVNLSDSPQWSHEEGYWIGEYTLLGEDGEPSTSTSWNYPYNHYKGFITGNVQGGAYRQRNVFMYPPQESDSCPTDGTSGVVGNGTCGTNGNIKVFWADQEASTCSTNVELAGDIEGPYGSLSYTYTQLVGQDNALLYQVFLTADALNYYQGSVLGNPGGACNSSGSYSWDCGYTEARLMQSQLTTITELQDGTVRRTRTAQGFDAFATVGVPTYASFYRERKVSEEEFWEKFDEVVSDYNITESDMCTWKSGETGGTVSSGYTAGRASCVQHLQESFDL